MNDMNISIRTAHIRRTPQLDAALEKKVQSLERYAKNIKDVLVEISGDAHHRKGNVVSIQMTVHLLEENSAPLRVEDAASDTHEAFDRALATMKKNIAAWKGKKSIVEKKLVRIVRGKE